jgi:hypothetical protein
MREAGAGKNARDFSPIQPGASQLTVASRLPPPAHREYDTHLAISLIVGRFPYMSSPTR